MRIQEIHVDGFGHFADTRFGSFDAPVTVFYGPNEAGKSTLLAFLRMMLFGFPRQLRAQHYPALRGGVHGGRLVLADDRGICYEIARSESRGSVSLEVTTSDGRRSSDDAFLAGPLGHASKEMFESVFAFSLAELQQFESLNRGDVSNQIYSAGMGAASLPSALKKLEDRQRELFKPGGSNQKVAGILKELDVIEARLRAAGDAASRYASLVARREDVRAQLDDVRAQLSVLTFRRQELDRLQRAWDDWVLRDQLLQRLAELPEFEDFPSDAIARLEKLEERVRTATEERVQRERAREQAKATAESCSQDLQILKSAPDIERLRRGQGAFASSVQDAPKREAELASRKSELADALRELGNDWDTARLQAFDISTPARASVDEWGRRLADDENTVRTLVIESSRAAQASTDAAEALVAEQAAIDALDPPPYTAEELGQRRGQLRTCRTILADLLRTAERRDDLQAQAGAEHPAPVATQPARVERALPAAFAAGGLLSIIVGAAVGDGALVLGVLSGISLLGGAGALMFLARRKSLTSGEPHGEVATATRRLFEEAARKAQKLEQDLARTASPFGETLPDTEALDRIESELDRAANALRDWTAAAQNLETARKTADRASRRAIEAEQGATAAQQRLDATHAEWWSWLRERRLPETILPGTMETVFARAEFALKCLQNVNDARRRLDGIMTDIREYAEPAAGLAATHGIQVDPEDPASVERASEELIRRVESARKAEAEGVRARQRLEEATSDLEDRARRATTAQTDLDALLALGSASDPEDFRRNAQSHATRQAVAVQLDECEQRLHRLAGPGDAVTQLFAELSNIDQATLDAECHRLTTELQGLDQRRVELSEEQGSIASEIKTLTSEEETSELRARREVLKASLESAARDWSVVTLARTLMADAQKKYEQERQPGVIRHADAFFSTITGGRYSKLMSPLGSRKLTVADHDGARKEPEHLSRGTQEALYLALRFGLIRQFGEQACRLPVIVDEVLVNFDPERARRAAEGFAELAHSNQVLVFTCHPGMVDLFTGACPDAQVIELNGAGSSAVIKTNGATPAAARLPLA